MNVLRRSFAQFTPLCSVQTARGTESLLRDRPELSKARVGEPAGGVLFARCPGRGQDVVSIDDPVGVALFGQESLTMRGEVGVDGVA